MWAALPPLALGWLGWIAPVPWLLLVRSEELTRPAAVRNALVRRIRVLAGRDSLAAVAASGRVPRLARAVGVSGVLLAGVRRPVARGRASTARAAVARRAGRLDRPRAGPRARDDRLHDGLARPHAGELAVRDSNQRPGGRVRRRFRDDDGRGVRYAAIRFSDRVDRSRFCRPSSYWPPRIGYGRSRLSETNQPADRIRHKPSASRSSKATAWPTGRPTSPSSSRS